MTNSEIIEFKFKTILFLLTWVLLMWGGYLIFSGLKRMRQCRKIEDTPCSKIKSAAQGLVEIQGNALPLKNGYPNYLGELVAYRNFKIQEQGGQGDTDWRTVFSEVEGHSFLVADETGCALVESNGGEFAMDYSETDWFDIPENMRKSLLSRYGTRVDRLADPKKGFFRYATRFRVKESVIGIGSTLYVRGLFSIPKDSAEISTGSKKIAINGVFRHDDLHGLLISDSMQTHLVANFGEWNLLRIVGGCVLFAAGAGMIFVFIF